MENTQQDYNEIYNDFIKRYNSGETFSGEQIGFIIVLLAQKFSEKNIILGVKESELRKIALANINTIEANGKPISAAKAEIITSADITFKEYRRIKIDLENIEQMLNAVKSLQKGMIQEYKNS